MQNLELHHSINAAPKNATRKTKNAFNFSVFQSESRGPRPGYCRAGYSCTVYTFTYTATRYNLTYIRITVATQR